MLPEFEKMVSEPVLRPLKKRYRHLFNGSSENTPDVNHANQQYDTFLNKLNWVPDTDVDARIFLEYMLNAPNFYCTSLIKRSITKHISIDELRKVLPMRRINTAKALSELQLQNVNRPTYLSVVEDDERSRSQEIVSYLMNHSSEKFVGKLKMKWLEKYETLEAGCDKYEPIKKNTFISHTESSETVVDRTLRSSRIEEKTKDDDAKEEEADVQSSPNERKPERARKGLIYQKFMASSYALNRKEKSSIKTSESTTQPKKRGRPRRKPLPVIVAETRDEDLSDNSEASSASTVRSEETKSESCENSVDTGVVETTTFNKPSPSRKRSLPSPECTRCGLMFLAAVENRKRTRKSSKLLIKGTCKCDVTDNPGTAVIDDVKVKRTKTK